MNFLEKLFSFRLRKFKAKHKMSFTVGKYQVKTADTHEELYQALRMRYKIFYSKFRRILFPLVVDMTPYEIDADHLLVKDGDKVVGTYRLRCSKFTSIFFSSSEFDISALTSEIENGKILVELSRACVDAQSRQGAVISCLWRGIFKYVKDMNSDYLFGCVTVMGKEPEIAASVTKYLEDKDLISNELAISPLPKYKVKNLKPALLGNKDVVPSLFSSYLKVGCKVYGEPAYDKRFKAFDFFTILRFSELNEAYERKLS